MSNNTTKEEISQEDARWIKENLVDPLEDSDTQFEAELFLSTDGKNTVHVKASTKEGRKAALQWAKQVYERLLYTYGSKQAQAVREYAQAANGGKVIPSTENGCQHVNVKFAQSKTEKNPGRWFKSCRDCSEFLGWQSA